MLISCELFGQLCPCQLGRRGSGIHSQPVSRGNGHLLGGFFIEQTGERIDKAHLRGLQNGGLQTFRKYASSSDILLVS